MNEDDKEPFENVTCPICKTENVDAIPLTGILIPRADCRCMDCGRTFTINADEPVGEKYDKELDT